MATIIQIDSLPSPQTTTAAVTFYIDPVTEAEQYRVDAFIDRQLRRMNVSPTSVAVVTSNRPSPSGITVPMTRGLHRVKKIHSYYTPMLQGISIPTFHPLDIMAGNQKLTGAWCFAVERALRLASGQLEPRKYELLLDPSLAVAREYFADGGLDTVVYDTEYPKPLTKAERAAADNDEEDDAVDQTTIYRVSFSNHVGTGITMPFRPPYMGVISDVLLRSHNLVCWNWRADVPRSLNNRLVVNGRVIDAMFAWHWLQSDLPKALAFVAPFYAVIEPWKHLASAQAAHYSAMDAAVEMDCWLGIEAQLRADGRLDMFHRHCTGMWPVLEQMSKAGVMLDLEHQAKFKARLEAERDAINEEMQAAVPTEVKPKKIYKRQPKDGRLVTVIDAPSAGGVRHYIQTLPFNAGSSTQVIALIKHLGLPVPRAKGENRDTTQSKHLKALVKRNGIFKKILDYRERAKLIDAYLWLVESDGRVRTSISFHPSTWRKSCRNPNVQTVPKRNDLAEEFRRMVIAGPGQVLVECDSSAIEAVLVGYFAGSESYINLAKAGVHKWLASEYAGRPVVKSEPLYDQIKRVVHLSNYRGTPARIAEEYPDTFASVKDARKLQEFYFATGPGQDVRAWQERVMGQAHKERMLQNPWGYRHYFYDVMHFAAGKWAYGDDAKRSVAYLPQSTASAIQTEYILALDDEMRGWLRWIVHDSIILEVPEKWAKLAALKLHGVMLMPFEELGGLSVGAEVKLGPNLAEMRELHV